MRLCLLLVLLLVYFQIPAQSLATGRVLAGGDERPIVNAKITISGKQDSLFTNRLGFFQATLDSLDELSVTYDGYESISFRWLGQKNFQVTLEEIPFSIYHPGMTSFYKEIGSKVKYSEKARRSQTFGTVYISFQINSQGALFNIQILKDPGKGLGEEVMRVLNLVPTNFIYDGRSSTYILPVQFDLDVINGTYYKRLRDETKFQGLDGKVLQKIVVSASVGGR